jgi:hypothetical protein
MSFSKHASTKTHRIVGRLGGVWHWSSRADLHPTQLITHLLKLLRNTGSNGAVIVHFVLRAPATAWLQLLLLLLADLGYSISCCLCLHLLKLLHHASSNGAVIVHFISCAFAAAWLLLLLLLHAGMCLHLLPELLSHAFSNGALIIHFISCAFAAAWLLLLRRLLLLHACMCLHLLPELLSHAFSNGALIVDGVLTTLLCSAHHTKRDGGF